MGPRLREGDELAAPPVSPLLPVKPVL